MLTARGVASRSFCFLFLAHQYCSCCFVVAAAFVTKKEAFLTISFLSNVVHIVSFSSFHEVNQRPHNIAHLGFCSILLYIPSFDPTHAPSLATVPTVGKRSISIDHRQYRRIQTTTTTNLRRRHYSSSLTSSFHPICGLELGSFKRFFSFQ